MHVCVCVEIKTTIQKYIYIYSPMYTLMLTFNTFKEIDLFVCRNKHIQVFSNL